MGVVTNKELAEAIVRRWMQWAIDTAWIDGWLPQVMSDRLAGMIESALDRAEANAMDVARMKFEAEEADRSTSRRKPRNGV